MSSIENDKDNNSSFDKINSDENILEQVSSIQKPPIEVLFPTREQYLDTIAQLHKNGYEMCIDLCVVDYLTHPGRFTPQNIAPQRFEVVVNLLSLKMHKRIRIKVQVPQDDPTIESIFTIYPGVEAMEREAYDLFGITFLNHPDMTRILMPEDWEGHPLRKDYQVGNIPVNFKEAPKTR